MSYFEKGSPYCQWAIMFIGHEWPDWKRRIRGNAAIRRIFQLPLCHLKRGYLTALGVEKYLKHLLKCIIKYYLILYYLLKGSFSRDFTYSAFSLWLCSSERIRGIYGNSKFFTQFQRFLSRSDLKIWHYTDFRNLKWIPLRRFCVKTPQLPGF